MNDVRPSSDRVSALMARVRSRGTGAEEAVAKALRCAGLRYRRNVVGLPGRPDFANRSRKWADFVNGCFWHHHRACRRATVPKSNAAFWIDKFRANRTRDARNVRNLRRAGFRVLIVWECEVGSFDPARLARRGS